MKKIIISLFAIGMIVGLSSNLVAQTNTDNATSAAFATIVAPITISHDGLDDLQFGTVISGIGDVTVSTAGVRTFTNSALNPGDQGATPTAAVFNLTGEVGYTYSIAFTNATETLTLVAGSDTMDVKNFVALSSDGEGLTGTLTGGSDQIKVGATLTTAGSLGSGVYEGSFEVTVAYN
jgi:hypothetical protein